MLPLHAQHVATYLQWRLFSADDCLLLGTSAGFLQLHSPASGQLLARQELHDTPLTSIAIR
jgi:hypothetical protein